MTRLRRVAALIVTGTLLSLASDRLGAQRVAITVDDLPSHGPLPPGMSRRQVADKIIAALQAGKVPQVYGMVIGDNIAKTPEGKELLEDWMHAGFLLGSHTASHMNLNESSTATWEADLSRNEIFLKPLMQDKDWHWLRFPYLAEGSTPAAHQEISTFLAANGYRVSPVTISFADYLFNAPYVRCLTINDASGAKQVEAMYMVAAAAAIKDSEAASQQLFGRDIPHVMLLHLGVIESVMLPRLITLLREQHFDFATLPEAMQDEAYKAATAGNGGLFLHEVALARHVQEPVASWRDQKALEAVCNGK